MLVGGWAKQQENDVRLRELLNTNQTSRQFPDRWTGLKAIIDTDTIDIGQLCGFGNLNEYRTELTIHLITRCNQVEWDNGEQEKAISHMFYELFEEPLILIRRAMQAVTARDEKEALACLDDACSAMKP